MKVFTEEDGGGIIKGGESEQGWSNLAWVM